jgi:hypothetical protein
MAELTFSGTHEPLSESFEEHYLRFVGADQSESLLYGSTSRNVDSVRTLLQSSPWLRTGLMGAGSIAATLMIGSALTEQANSQLHPPEYPEFPQPDVLGDSRSQEASSPRAIASPTPTPPELMDSIEVQTARRPFRDLLAERLQQRLFSSSLATPELPAAIAQANRSTPGQANPVMSAAVSGSSSLPNSVPLADLPQLQANSAEMPNGVTSTQSPATEQVETPAASHPIAAGSLELNEAIALKPFTPGSVSTPERIVVERASVTPLPEFQQGTSTANTVVEPRSTSFADIPTFLHPEVQIQPLTQEEVLKISQAESSFRVVHVSSQDYQRLWAILNAGEPSPAPVYGFVDQKQQVVLLPFGNRDENSSSVGQ